MSVPTMPTDAERRGPLGTRILALTLLVVGSAGFVYPFLWMIATALRTPEGVAHAGAALWPLQWQWSNFAEGLGSFPFLTYLRNSLLSTLVPVVAVVFSSSLVGFAFARIRARGAGVLFAVVLSTLLLPQEVTIVPQFILFRNLDMIDTLWPIIVPTFFGSAFFIFLYRQFYLRLPEALTDAALIDGAGWFRIWFSIYLPLSRPIIIATAVLQFMSYWNNFFQAAIYLTTDRWKTLPLALAGFQSVNGTDTPLLMATALVVTAPCVLLFFVAQRHIIGGISFTGSK
ncbi:N-Acetyl-D-glucosamine ABC transport system, permease protein 2 [[Actinomadura] parvosata subsp. kistnae]|uniref:carbohydrate ABC transporter permease n=1 Tax=[Actinomadura] parvosata TaxID=1955412 RepID=UPI0009AC1ED8|nr:carbohydrate ABC transporter permease [Nonomuraea sp. ATCC 55076]SPL96391.1 N-Acetyl-D-glucosamine ABC transport system, permease protein 2 [Actinomadura parvosata subsp. kistnae]